MANDIATDRLAGTWNLHPMHSVAEFRVRFVVNEFRSRFAQFTATLEDGRLSGEVPVSSVVIDEGHGFKGHVLAADFFDAENHPTLSFTTDTLTIEGDDVVLDGALTIKGITKPIRATGTVAGPTPDANGFTLLGFSLRATLDRGDFGFTWNSDLPGGGQTLAAEVDLIVELEFSKAG